MNWKDYSGLESTHAFLSPSKYHWLNYDDEKLASAYTNFQRTIMGTKYHALAQQLIAMAVRLPNNGSTFNSYVNDAIGFKMTPEVVLYYSPFCYGTADCISFYDDILRIHDLKTGVSPGSMNQLLIYAALFCLDYKIEKQNIQSIHLRIYQNEEVVSFEPTLDGVFSVVNRIVEANRILETMDSSTIW